MGCQRFAIIGRYLSIKLSKENSDVQGLRRVNAIGL